MASRDISETQPTVKPWGLVATVAWGTLAFVIGQSVATIVVVWAIWDGRLPFDFDDGPLVAVATLVANPLQFAVLAGFVRRRGSIADYLALGTFRGRDFLIGFAATAALIAAVEIVGWLVGLDTVTPFQISIYTSAHTLPWLVALGIAIVIVAPLGEEALFRGFLFRGLVKSDRMAPWGILAISFIWAVIHVQYDWFGILHIFMLGLVFGWVRWRSGSTTITFVLHALVNLGSAIQTVIRVGWVH